MRGGIIFYRREPHTALDAFCGGGYSGSPERTTASGADDQLRIYKL
jgi:hypothetical protein